MAQVVSRRPLTAEARVRALVSLHGSCVGKIGLAQIFLRVLQFSPVSIIPPLLHGHTYIIWGVNNRPVSGRSSETWSHSGVEWINRKFTEKNSNKKLIRSGKGWQIALFCVLSRTWDYSAKKNTIELFPVVEPKWCGAEECRTTRAITYRSPAFDLNADPNGN
jgi:hypothetical protein